MYSDSGRAKRRKGGEYFTDLKAEFTRLIKMASRKGKLVVHEPTKQGPLTTLTSQNSPGCQWPACTSASHDFWSQE